MHIIIHTACQDALTVCVCVCVCVCVYKGNSREQQCMFVVRCTHTCDVDGLLVSMRNSF